MSPKQKREKFSQKCYIQKIGRKIQNLKKKLLKIQELTEKNDRRGEIFENLKKNGHKNVTSTKKLAQKFDAEFKKWGKWQILFLLLIYCNW